MDVYLIGLPLIPSILQYQVHLVDLLPPKAEELYPVFKEVLPEDWNSELVENLSKDAKGIPLQVARQAAQLIKTKKFNDLEKAKELLLKVKQQEVKKTGVLEYCVPQGNGGLDNLKFWITERKRWFEQNDEPKLRPRAILLEGFPGCGKSFVANGIAKEWNVPLINFEISRLKSKFVGETENKTIEALRAIDVSAPCILFIDEIEKAFAGIGTDSSGVSTHQFGTFLSWLNAHQSQVFVIVTSNDSEKLPPELFRPGRFDKRFVFLLPTLSERCQILKNRIHAHGLNLDQDFSLNQLDSELNLEGFSGAELDQLVKEAIYQRPQKIPPRLPTLKEWKQAREQIHPQINNPVMKTLLRKYLENIKAGVESASKPEGNFWEKLVKEQNFDK